MSSEQTVHANGVQFHVQIDGDSDSPWIMLSNSLGSNLHMWDPQIDFLTTRYQVLRYDTRGHGKTNTPGDAYSFDDLTSDVLALLDHFKIDKTWFMGLSMGGMTGMGLAIHHPERFHGIICCDARADAPEGFAKSWDDRAAVIRAKGMDALVDGTMERWLTPQTRAREPEKESKLADMVRHTDPDGYIGCARAIQKLDYLKDLGKVTIPMLYVGGEVDSGAMPDVMREMAAATPGASYAMIPDAAHIANLEKPGPFNEAIAPVLELGI